MLAKEIRELTPDDMTARKAMDLAAAKLPIRTRFVIREQQLGS